MHTYSRLIRLFLIIVVPCCLASCNSYNFSRHVIQQGNLLTPNVVNRLKVGMSKPDVAILMGSSLLSPLFNNDRWDYAYTKQAGSQFKRTNHLVLTFKHDRLTAIEYK